MQSLIQLNIKSVIKLQAFMRRVIAQINIRDRIENRDMYRVHARYFVREELFETLDKFQKNTERIGMHKYQNGGKYEG